MALTQKGQHCVCVSVRVCVWTGYASVYVWCVHVCEV